MGAEMALRSRKKTALARYAKKRAGPTKARSRSDPVSSNSRSTIGSTASHLPPSEIRRAWDKLAASEEHFRALVEYASDAIAVIDAQGTIVYASQTTTRVLGYEIDQLVGRNAFDIIHPEDLERTKAIFAECLASPGLPIRTEYRALHNDGSWVELEGVGVNRLDHPGVRGIAVSYRDVSERKLAEKVIRESGRMFAAVFEGAGEAMLLADPEGFCLEANEAASQLFGMMRPALIGRHLGELSEPRANFDAAWRSLEAKGEVKCDLRIMRPDGLKREVHFSATGKIAEGRNLAIYHDVTEWKQSQDAPLHLASIVESSGNAIIGLDSNGTIVSWNSSAERLYGHPPEEILGRSLEVVFPPERSPDSNELLRHVREGLGLANYESIGFRKSGERVHVSVAISPLKNMKAQVTGAAVIVWDISERKRTELELQRTKEAAEAANRAKSDFVANVSHEIRTPLNGIIGMIELALQTGLNPGQERFLHTARMASDALLEVINDILDLSKIEAGKYETVSVDFSLRDSVSDTVRALAYVANQKGIHLDCRFDSDVPDALVGDRGRLRQIVLNLAGNAVKFTDVGEVVVGASVEEKHGGRVKLHFTVRDTGIGVPEATRSLIFQAFTQADSSDTRKHGGTGLGLTIASQLVKSAGGRIWVESDVGVGSTFHFTASYALSQRQPDLASQVKHVVMGDLRPLIVERDGPECRGLVDMFAGWGVTANVAPTGLYAMNILDAAVWRGEPFNLILVDSGHADIDGSELAEQIDARRRELGNPAVILMTEEMLHRTGQSREGTGVSAYLTRPIGPTQLRNAMDLVWKRRMSAVPSASPVDELIDTTRKLHVLSVEDNTFNQMVVTSRLEQDGHTVAVAANGYEAIEALERGTFDLVLMDVQMPQMDGIQATGVIRDREKSSGGRIPIVAMTARAMVGDRERCLAAGMDGYLAKPVHAEDLRRLLDRIGSASGLAALDSPPAGEPVFDVLPDRDGLLRRVQGDAELLERMVKIFREQSRQLIEELMDAITRSDGKAVNEAAHALKGSIAYWCQGRAFQIARELEAQGRSGDLAGAFEAGQELVAEYEKLESDLTTVLRGANDQEVEPCHLEPS
jgi:PAS domain S-box-containing protein